MRSSNPKYLVIRYSDKLFSVNDVIRLHQEVIEKYGAVWMGKFGKPLGIPYITALSKQIEQGIPTFVYLVQKEKSTYKVFVGKIMMLSRNMPENEFDLIPPYYSEREILDKITFWIKLHSIRPLAEDETKSFNMLRVASTGTRLPLALASSMAAMFIVREPVNID